MTLETCIRFDEVGELLADDSGMAGERKNSFKFQVFNKVDEEVFNF